MKSPIPQPCICLVTDRRRLTPDARTASVGIARLEGWLDEAIDAGVDIIQVREPDLDARLLVPLVSRLVSRADGTPARIVVNDRVDAAIAAHAAGVHLRSDGPPAARVRALAGRAMVGRSIHGASETNAVDGVDYAIFGTVYASASKPGASPAGLERLSAAAHVMPVPVLAIGGITPERARACRGAGAAGVAAIGLFLPEDAAVEGLGIRRAAALLREAMADAPANLLE